MLTKENIKIIIIEDSVIHSEWLKAIISDEKSLTLLDSFQNGRAGAVYVKDAPVDIVIIDFQLKDMTGLEVCKRIKSYNSNIKTFMLTAHTEISIIHRIINDKNVDAISIKGSPYFDDNFHSAILHVAKGGTYIDPSLLGKLRESMTCDTLSNLTKREFEIFIQLNIGKNEWEITSDLNIELSYLRNVKSKLSKKINGGSVQNLLHKLLENAYQ